MYLELLLLGFLVLFMYYQPRELKIALQTILGKLIAIMVVATIAMWGGRHAGVLAAVIFLLLLHIDREGFKDTAKEKEGKKPAVVHTNPPKTGITTPSSKTTKPTKKNKPQKKTNTSINNKIPVLSVMNQLDLDRQIKTKGLQKSQEARGENSGAATGTYKKPVAHN